MTRSTWQLVWPNIWQKMALVRVTWGKGSLLFVTFVFHSPRNLISQTSFREKFLEQKRLFFCLLHSLISISFQIVLNVSFVTHWPKEAACISSAASVGMNSAVAATNRSKGEM